MTRKWDEELAPHLSIDVLRSFATEVLLPRVCVEKHRARLAFLLREASADGPLALLAGWEPDYEVYAALRPLADVASATREDLASLRAERQIAALFSKLTFGPVDGKAVALRSFLDSETRCKETNQLLKQARQGNASLLGSTAARLHEAKRLVSHVLGEAPNLAALMQGEPGVLGFRLGKGATARVKRKDASPYAKLGQVPTCAAPLFASLGAVLSGVPFYTAMHARASGPQPLGGESLNVHIVDAIWDSVKKNYKTERGICKEPDLNVPVQGALGRYIATRLRVKAGLDIRDQTRNQRLAYLASVSGDVATLDLKSASDLISRELVAELLPLDWFVLLDRARSSRCVLPSGETITLEKFSSMGNGFTFPLETLIFWALVSSVCGTDEVSVYGDDIVCPARDFADVVTLLEACGFAVNTAKSFSSGTVRFRESCGKDFFFGDDIRPAFVRGNLSDRRLVALHNFFARASDYEACRALARYISPSNCYFGPDGLGDGHLLVTPFSNSVDYRPYSREKGFSGFTFKTHVAKPRWADLPVVPVESSMAAILYDVERRVRLPFFAGLPNSNAGTKQALVILDDSSSIRHRKDGKLEVALPGGLEDEESGTLVYQVKRIVVEDRPDDSCCATSVVVIRGRKWLAYHETGAKPRLRLA